MENKKYISSSPYQTKKIAYSLVQKILKIPVIQNQALILALIGELGTGKTTFVKRLAQALNIIANILSPTFIIERKFPIRKTRFKYFYHFDCYRLKRGEELINLGFKDIISSPKNFVVIEWADRVMSLLPSETIFLKFTFLSQNKREIRINYG